MKKSQIITTMLMAGMLLAGCSNKPAPSTSTVTPTTPTTPTTSNPGPTSTTPQPSMEHQSPFVKDLEE